MARWLAQKSQQPICNRTRKDTKMQTFRGGHKPERHVIGAWLTVMLCNSSYHACTSICDSDLVCILSGLSASLLSASEQDALSMFACAANEIACEDTQYCFGPAAAGPPPPIAAMYADDQERTFAHRTCQVHGTSCRSTCLHGLRMP